MSVPPGEPSRIRYLSAGDVSACLPSLEARLDIASRALRALAQGSAEMPPKIGVHPRPGALLHAMPAWAREVDVVGMKWVSAYGGNAERGLPAIQALIVLNDPDTGAPTCILDGSVITTARTTAVSGVALRSLAPASVRCVALVGAGAQGRAHAELVRDLFPAAAISVYDRHPERALGLLRTAAANGFAAISLEETVTGADVVITMGALGSAFQILSTAWLAPTCVVVAVDFATHAPAALALEAGTFAVDDRAQFLAYREAGYFDGYPDPVTTLGELLLRGDRAGSRDGVGSRDGAGRVLVTHLGIGLADVLFADAVARVAESRGLGQLLPR